MSGGRYRDIRYEPDIGDFSDVPMVESTLQPGDIIKPRTRWSRSNPTRRRWTCRHP